MKLFLQNLGFVLFVGIAIGALPAAILYIIKNS